MFEAVEYMIGKDEEFKQIYDKSVELQRMSETSETTSDIEVLRKYAKSLSEQGGRMVVYLIKKYSENSSELVNIIEKMNGICKQIEQERDYMLDVIVEALGITREEFYQMYAYDTQDEPVSEPEPEKKSACHLKRIK